MVIVKVILNCVIVNGRKHKIGLKNTSSEEVANYFTALRNRVGRVQNRTYTWYNTDAFDSPMWPFVSNMIYPLHPIGVPQSVM
jgi:hypothetical protein